MRSFFAICLVAVACADKLGYNYQPVDHSNSSLSFAPGSGVSASLNGNIGNYGSSSNVAPLLDHQGDYFSATHDAPSYAPQREFEKEFFSYTANEDDFNEPAASNQFDTSVNQGLRVVFIKGPENNGLKDAAFALTEHAAEQKTDIYVFQKQADINSLANNLNSANKNNNNKPEVHFVKYRTHVDAVNAQKAIQDQYDSLGGSSQSHDGGVAPVLNFAFQAPVSVASQHSAASAPAPSYRTDESAPAAIISTGVSAPVSSYIPPAPVADDISNTYLPATILRLFRL